MPASDLKLHLIARGLTLGFDVVRVASPGSIGEAGGRLDAFLAAGRHGDMTWLATHAGRRRDPRALWDGVRSVIMVGLNHAPADDPLAALQDRRRGVIATYAKGEDYHDLIKTRLKRLASAFAEETGAEVKVFVDTAPLMEKPLAAAAGLGWQGKHTNLVSRAYGSWLFLGAILTDAALEPDAPEEDHCGSCRRCLDVCPTAAFPNPYELDARRCIAYLTIEHKGPIPREFRAAMGNRVFGCDDCLAVCPWNKYAQEARETRFAAREETANPPLETLLRLDDGAFRARFRGTPIKRTGRNRVVRNAAIAAGNSGDRDLVPALRDLLGDASPLVRGAATWALARLDPALFAAARATYGASERDADVRREWDLGAAA